MNIVNLYIALLVLASCCKCRNKLDNILPPAQGLSLLHDNSLNKSIMRGSCASKVSMFESVTRTI